MEFSKARGVKILNLSVIVYGYLILELPNLQYTLAANPKLFSFIRNLTSNSTSATRSSVFGRHVEERGQKHFVYFVEKSIILSVDERIIVLKIRVVVSVCR